MAVINAYQLSSTIKSESNGGQVIAIAGSFETVATDSAGSKYRLAKVGADWVPLQIEINNDAISGLDDVDLGFYETLENGGAAKDADILLDGGDISGGCALGSEQNGLANLPIDEIGDPVYSLADDSDASEQMYDLVLTSNSAVAQAGTVSIRALFVKSA